MDDDSIPPIYEAARDIELFNPGEGMFRLRGKPGVKAAFKWYNTFVKPFKPIGMGCQPCYVTVYQKLKEVKQKIAEIDAALEKKIHEKVSHET